MKRRMKMRENKEDEAQTPPPFTVPFYISNVYKYTVSMLTGKKKNRGDTHTHTQSLGYKLGLWWIEGPVVLLL